MQKRHVDHGSAWEEDEETAAYRGYTNNTPFRTLVETFPTDRDPMSIRLKLKNHQWQETNGQKGLRGGNKWVRDRWARSRVAVVAYHEEENVKLRKRRQSLYDELDEIRDRQKKLIAELNEVRDEIASRERRQLEIVRLPQ